MVAQDVHFAPLGSCVGSLHVDEHVLPRQLGTHAIICGRGPERRLNGPGAIALADFTCPVPFIKVRPHGRPIPHSSQQLVTLGSSTMRVQSSGVSELV